MAPPSSSDPFAGMDPDLLVELSMLMTWDETNTWRAYNPVNGIPDWGYLSLGDLEYHPQDPGIPHVWVGWGWSPIPDINEAARRAIKEYRRDQG